MAASSAPSRGFSLHVNITIDPSNMDEFLAALKPCYEAVVAEPHCTYFEVFHSQDAPGAFRFVENWTESKEWFLEVRKCFSFCCYGGFRLWTSIIKLTMTFFVC